jgi:hypothetical protein
MFTFLLELRNRGSGQDRTKGGWAGLSKDAKTQNYISIITWNRREYNMNK